MLKESLLAAALALPAWHGDKESDVDRSARLAVIVQAIDEAVAIATCRFPEPKRASIGAAELSARTNDEDDVPRVETNAKNTTAAPSAAPTPAVSSGAGPLAHSSSAPQGEVLASATSPEADPDASTRASLREETRALLGATDAPCKRVWAGSSRELGFLLLAQAFFETRLALHVHEGNCRKEIGECDSGRAISLWQLHAGYRLPVERWRELAGTDLDSTRAAALEAARALGRSRNFCGSTEGAVANYATGRGCVWRAAEERVRFAARLTEKYWRKARPTPPARVAAVPDS